MTSLRHVASGNMEICINRALKAEGLGKSLTILPWNFLLVRDLIQYGISQGSRSSTARQTIPTVRTSKRASVTKPLPIAFLPLKTLSWPHQTLPPPQIPQHRPPVDMRMLLIIGTLSPKPLTLQCIQQGS